MKGVYKGLAIISSVFLAFVSLFVLAVYVVPVFAAHTPVDSLAPEWSPASQLVDYTVTVCNNASGGGDRSMKFV